MRSRQSPSKAKPGLKWRVIFADVMAEVAEALFDPAGLHREHAHVAKAEGPARFDQGIVDAGCEFGRDHEFIAEFAKE